MTKNTEKEPMERKKRINEKHTNKIPKFFEQWIEQMTFIFKMFSNARDLVQDPTKSMFPDPVQLKRILRSKRQRLRAGSLNFGP